MDAKKAEAAREAAEKAEAERVRTAARQARRNFGRRSV